MLTFDLAVGDGSRWSKRKSDAGRELLLQVHAFACPSVGGFTPKMGPARQSGPGLKSVFSTGLVSLNVTWFEPRPKSAEFSTMEV